MLGTAGGGRIFCRRDGLQCRDTSPTAGETRKGDGRKSMPTRFTFTGEVIDSGGVTAVGRPKPLDDRKDSHSQIRSGRRPPALVLYNPHHGLLGGQPQHGTDESIAVGPADPPGAYHGGARRGLAHRWFARQILRSTNLLQCPP